MTHMVIVHRSNDTTYHPCDGLPSAISTMERFRNEEGVEALELFQMSQVEFEFKPYYQVAIAGEEGVPASQNHLAAVAPATEASVSAPVDMDVEAEASVETDTVASVGADAADPFNAPVTADPYADPIETADDAPVEVPMAAAPSVVAFPSAQPDVPAAVDAAIVPPPAPPVAVPAPVEAAEPSPMFAEAFEADAFLAEQPAPPTEVPAGSGLGFELAPQSENAPSPFGGVPQSNGLLADPPPPPPPPSEDGGGILAEMTEMADSAESKDKEPRRGLFGR